MHSKWRHFTKAARREQFEDLMDARFRSSVLKMSDKELAECMEFASEKLAKTHARFIYVRQRLEYKVSVLRGESLKRVRVNV